MALRNAMHVLWTARKSRRGLAGSRWNTSPSTAGGSVRIGGGIDADRGADEPGDLLARHAAGPPPGPAGKPPVLDSAALAAGSWLLGSVKHPKKIVGNFTAAVLPWQHPGSVCWGRGVPGAGAVPKVVRRPRRARDPGRMDGWRGLLRLRCGRPAGRRRRAYAALLQRHRPPPGPQHDHPRDAGTGWACATASSAFAASAAKATMTR